VRRQRTAILAETLIAQPGRDAICPEECRQKMAFRATVAAPDPQHFRSRAGNGLKKESTAMTDVITDPVAASLGDDDVIVRTVRQRSGSSKHLVMRPVDHVSRSEELIPE
jgi:hypothetical protein